MLYSQFAIAVLQSTLESLWSFNTSLYTPKTFMFLPEVIYPWVI